MKIKIQSISDLITNSSSEVFVIYTKKGIQEFKNIVSTLIDDDFDNHFNLELCLDEYYAPDKYKKRSEDEKDLSFEDWCFRHDAKYYESPTTIEGFIITAKNPEDLEKANQLNRIYGLFESESRYC